MAMEDALHLYHKSLSNHTLYHHGSQAILEIYWFVIQTSKEGRCVMCRCLCFDQGDVILTKLNEHGWKELLLGRLEG